MDISIIEEYGFVNMCILQEMQNIFKPISVWTLFTMRYFL